MLRWIFLPTIIFTRFRLLVMHPEHDSNSVNDPNVQNVWVNRKYVSSTDLCTFMFEALGTCALTKSS